MMTYRFLVNGCTMRRPCETVWTVPPWQGPKEYGAVKERHFMIGLGPAVLPPEIPAAQPTLYLSPVTSSPHAVGHPTMKPFGIGMALSCRTGLFSLKKGNFSVQLRKSWVPPPWILFALPHVICVRTADRRFLYHGHSKIKSFLIFACGYRQCKIKYAPQRLFAIPREPECIHPGDPVRFSHAGKQKPISVSKQPAKVAVAIS